MLGIIVVRGGIGNKVQGIQLKNARLASDGLGFIGNFKAE